MRSLTLYKQGHFIDSVHVAPGDTSLTSLQKYRLKKHIVIVGERMDDARDFANFLIQKGFPFVSMLHGGYDVIEMDASDHVRK